MADAAKALVNADKANVASAQAQLDAQQAAVDPARVQLSYCVIKSPIDGRTGNLAVKVGSLITANQLEMIESVPMTVDALSRPKKMRAVR